jgi:hypothetical protein
MDTATTKAVRAAPWNKGKLVGQKPPLKLKGIWRCSNSPSTTSCAVAI